MINIENLIVSVIIPVFNVRPYFREALDSVIHQTYTNLEIILIDDGSTDGSGELCDEYAAIDKRITVIHQDNRGLSAARNVGLDIITGQMVTFLDPDDAFCPKTIEIMLEAMLREEADLVVCKYTIIQTENELIQGGQERPLALPGIYDFTDALRLVIDEKLNICVWNKLYRCDLWQDIRFPVDRVYEDWPVVLPIIEKTKKTCVLSDVLYMHRIRVTSISMTPSLIKLDNWITNYTEFESFVKKHVPIVFSEQQLQKTRERNVYRMIEQYVKCRNLRELGQFRKRVLEKTKKISIKNPRIWCMYQALRYCPRMLRLMYCVYAKQKTVAVIKTKS